MASYFQCYLNICEAASKMKGYLIFKAASLVLGCFTLPTYQLQGCITVRLFLGCLVTSSVERLQHPHQLWSCNKVVSIAHLMWERLTWGCFTALRQPYQLLGNCETASPFFCYSLNWTSLHLAAILMVPHCGSEGSGGASGASLFFHVWWAYTPPPLHE